MPETGDLEVNKIGIVTLSGKHNYGNRLQNYALQKALIELSHGAITLVESEKSSPKILTKNIAKYFLAYTPLYKSRLSYFMKKQKSKKFQAFDDQHITEKKLSSSMIDNFDLFISGSDQVWNPKFAAKDHHFLTFAPKKKRVSYAASFGVSEIPEEQADRYSRLLKDFKHISVREEDGKKLVEKLTGRKDAAVVPDPTMLLSRKDWNELIDGARPVNAPKSKYVLVYALHALTESNQKKLNDYAKRNKLKIYQIMGDLYDKEHHTPDPAEFVWLIANSEAVFTDSFHCCVFSIIYHRPFVVFDRTDGQKMSSRLETLTKRFQLKQAMVSENSDVEKVLKSESFSKVDKILADYRNVGIGFLNKVLK